MTQAAGDVLQVGIDLFFGNGQERREFQRLQFRLAQEGDHPAADGGVGVGCKVRSAWIKSNQSGTLRKSGNHAERRQNGGPVRRIPPNIVEPETSSDPERLFAYRKNWRFFAQIGEGLEEVGAAELAELGATELVPAFRGVHLQRRFRHPLPAQLPEPALHPDSRPADHLRLPFHQVPLQDGQELPWEDLLDVRGTFAIAATVGNSAINHSKYAALCLKDAIADRYRERYDRRPDVDRDHPDLQLNLHIDRNRAVISLDTSRLLPAPARLPAGDRGRPHAGDPGGGDHRPLRLGRFPAPGRSLLRFRHPALRGADAPGPNPGRVPA